MNIGISSISLRNFKGVDRLDVNFGKNTSIYGQNATGKTTIFDAFLWCLFGKDSQNKADFDIKGLDSQGNAAHNLNHSVDVSLEVDGKGIVLSKIYTEKWTKKRGSAAAEFTGHTTEYSFNGVPCKEKEYQERIKGIIDENVFRLLTDPRRFNEQISWQDRRKILMNICGDVSIDEVIASDKKLSGLKNILNGNNIEDLKKIIASQKKEINDELQKIPVRIDEATRSMMPIRADIAQVPGMIKDLEGKKAALESQLSDLRNGGAVSAKRIELQDIQAEIQKMKNTFNENIATRIAPLNEELSGLQDQGSAVHRKISSLESEAKATQSTIDAIEKELEGLRSAWVTIDAQECTEPTTCPTCGQALPDIQINDAREKFLNAKASKLAGIDERGKAAKATLVASKRRAEEVTREIEALKGEWRSIEDRQNEVRKQIAAIRAMQPDLSGLEAKKASIQAEIDNISASELGLVSEVQSKLSHVKAEISTLEADLNRVQTNEATQKRIIELGEREKELAAQYEALEGNLFLVESFIRAKVGFLEKRINNKFRLARFKLFEDQINGGLAEVCETTLNGVPYPSINNAGRIQSGMDIIRALQDHYGIKAPVWIDNRESIIELPEMDCQIISLVVSDADKNLRVAS